MTDFMSSLKPAWHLDKIAALRRGENIVPPHLQLIISDLCNQNCSFCSYRMDGGFSTEQFADIFGNRNPRRFIPTGKAIDLLLDYKNLGGQAVEFTGGGEPLVHPDATTIMAFAQDLGLKTGLVTNGVLLDDDEVFRDLDWLRISLDAGTEATYRQTRESSMWERVLRNIQIAATFKKPKVGVGFVVTKENAHEIRQACELVAARGISYLRLSAMFSTQGAAYYDGMTLDVPQIPGLTVVNFFKNRVADLEQGAPDYQFCGQMQFGLYIGGDLKVYTCCTNAYTKHGEIGDLRNQSFKEWIAATDRRQFDARTCHHCQFNDKNRLINYLIQPDPVHVEFV